MAADGVSGQILYPTLGLRLLGLDDQELMEACARVTNDYLAEYCSVLPDRLWGIATVPCYNIKNAVQEMTRCKEMGMRGVMIWQVAPEGIRFTSQHYEEFWAAAQDLEMPVNLHILTGFNYSRRTDALSGPEAYRNSVNTKLHDAVTSVFDLIFTGVLERYPRLKFVLVENEIGWIPFVLHQWDRYVQRFGAKRPIAIDKPPSFYFNRQIYNTFFNDPPGGHVLSFWGQDICLWSSDYPHGNSTWPNSRQIIARDLSQLDPETRAKVLRENVARLYNLPIPRPIGG
jgi:predicted TIM-barrel fold metal-dependent hydrolase